MGIQPPKSWRRAWIVKEVHKRQVVDEEQRQHYFYRGLFHMPSLHERLVPLRCYAAPSTGTTCTLRGVRCLWTRRPHYGLVLVHALLAA